MGTSSGFVFPRVWPTARGTARSSLLSKKFFTSGRRLWGDGTTITSCFSAADFVS